MIRQLTSRLNRRNPGICHDVKGWALEHKCEVDVLRPSETVERALPLPPEKCPEAFVRDQVFQTNERFTAELEGARLCGYEGFVVLPDGQFAFDYNTSYDPFITQHPMYFQRWSKGVRREDWSGSYYSIVGKFCREHYHWLHDSLGQLHQVVDLLPAETRVVIPDGLSGSQLRLLDAVGVPEGKRSILPSNSIVRLERLLFIPPACPTRFDEQQSSCWLRSALRKSWTCSARGNRVIYVSRRKARSRRVLNESRLLRLLADFDAEVVCLEEIGLDEQIDLFSQCRVVVAPHGAGLTNVIFSEPGLSVVEIGCKPFDGRTHYWSMAEALGHAYHLIEGQPVPVAEGDCDIELPEHSIIELGELLIACA
ncbi:MAG: glycosyltransferase family 61 protein [Planctomycetales bacterium]|nr:glycosyltransferase family 61 protein [Planctomycetales bacterium]